MPTKMLTAKTLPCNLPCPKCGNKDIYRQYRRKGEAYHRLDGLTEGCETPRLVYGGYWVRAKVECIVHHCRVCHYEWDTGVK